MRWWHGPITRLAGATARLRTLAPLLVQSVIVLAVLIIAALTIGPRVAPYRTFIVLSGSMAPAIPTGSVVVVRPVQPETVRVGDVITYWPASRRQDAGPALTHRIVEIVEPGRSPLVLTKGDANPTTDTAVERLGQPVWKLLFTVPWAGYVLVFSQTTAGRLLLVVATVVLALAGVYDLRRVGRS